MVQTVRHPLRLDEQHAIERVARCRLEVRRLIDPGIAVPAPAVLLDDALHLIPRDVRRPFEIHVLDPVGDAGEAGTFVLGPDLVPAPHRRERRGVLFLDKHPQSVVECSCTHPSYIIEGYPCPSGRTPSTCRAPTSR